MRALAIPPDAFDDFPDLLDSMHRLRARIFKGRLGWDVVTTAGREIDEFDALKPTYILAISSASEVAGCARLLPASGPTMIEALFPDLVQSGAFKPHSAMIESSRFCVDTSLDEGRAGGSLHDATLTMFAAIIEWSMANGYRQIVTGTDLRIERILNRAGWPMSRIGEPRRIGETTAIAGMLPADRASLERVRPPSYRSVLSPKLRAA
ncbi:GNAT family N-acetyltransferase [Mesorhizobium sp. M5C.F.Cr.IN.023.01.1.1]|uniref:acyl-homoserine-lactone synthase n=1 Tax=Mesorhizobium sp. M5C.F.Cr.IN.023.01.1.1 TaxID=2496768 RepID=UPI000FCC3DCC|nr:acyl-homoserine-lactone synthase TraI [Mesorhizobium sp. M5C.F.Cr.IN.023.01.1.1]RUV66441.1 GNAT family N-acetyltransferase [Mesorhizobium sp. M5C.F.Cr.IN.023.01.1.1]